MDGEYTDIDARVNRLVQIICDVHYGAMEALRQYMSITGKNQTELAHLIGCDVTELSRWLNKQRLPTIITLKQISEKTGIKLEKLAEDL